MLTTDRADKAPTADVAEATVTPATDDAVAAAADDLRAGRLVAFPTETVYGLGGDATNDAAVAAIFAAKGRPRFNPLIVHCADKASAEKDAAFDERAAALAARFWPGPLSLVLPRRTDSRVSLLVSAGLPSIAVRVPRNDIARRLLSAFGGPVAAPSANRSGEVSPTTAEHVVGSLPQGITRVLDGGPCAVGIESSVVDLTDDVPRLLRPGGLTREDIEAVTGPLAPPDDATTAAPKSPGMQLRHYATRAPLRLNARAAEPGEALLAFGPTVPEPADVMLNLSRSGDTTEAAANLFAMLRALDQPEVARIAIMPIPESGLGVAINDRLRRATISPT